MGLDMYLEGRKFLWSHKPEHRRPIEDGFEVETLVLRLGYWRKHPNLHGFIVQTFADGRDECQEIELGEDAIGIIITAILAQDLPHTEGFFFGSSEHHSPSDDLLIWQAALSWLQEEDSASSRSVVYRASW